MNKVYSLETDKMILATYNSMEEAENELFKLGKGSERIMHWYGGSKDNNGGRIVKAIVCLDHNSDGHLISKIIELWER
jgi:hypothetical protein